LLPHVEKETDRVREKGAEKNIRISEKLNDRRIEKPARFEAS
jgi:hypothetical protein